MYHLASVDKRRRQRRQWLASSWRTKKRIESVCWHRRVKTWLATIKYGGVNLENGCAAGIIGGGIVSSRKPSKAAVIIEMAV